MRHRLLASIVASTTLFVASSAFAQETAPPPAAPAAAPAPAPAAAPAAPKADSDEEADAKGRLWIGFNVGGGVGTGADLSGPAFDVAFRAGWVLNSNMAIYGNLTGIAWVAGSSKLSGVTLSAVGGQLITPMFAYSPADIIELAAGPSLDHLAGGSASAGTGGASASAFDSIYFGVQGRIALHLGGRNAESRRRRGFTLSADIHPSFVENGPVTFITGGLGADWF